MIKRMLRVLAVSTLALVGLIATASAQSATSTKDVKVDFDFYAGKKLMPAGEYVVKLIPNSQSHKLILIQQVHGDAQAIVTSVPNRNKMELKPGTVIFNKYGDQYFLSGVQLGERNLFHTVLKTRTERDLSRGVVTEANHQ